MHGYGYGKTPKVHVLSAAQREYNEKAEAATQKLKSDRDAAVTGKDWTNALDTYLDTIYNLRDRLGVKESTSVAG